MNAAFQPPERWATFLRRAVAAQAGRLALLLPVCAIAGDALYFALRAEPARLLGTTVLAAGLLVRAAGRRYAAWRFTGMVVAAFGFGFASPQWAAWRAPGLPDLPHSGLVAGTVAILDTRAEGARLTLRPVAVDGQALPGQALRLTVANAADLAVGDRIEVRARLFGPDPPAYPGARDPQREAFFTSLAGNGYAPGTVRVTASAAAGWLAERRAGIAARLRAGLPGANGAIAAALMTGLTAAIPADLRQAYNDAGLAHLLAIAGLHIGVVMGVVLAAARWALLRSERVALRVPVWVVAGCLSLAAGLGYLLLTGAHVPILRAFTMAALVLLAVLSGRRAAALRCLGLAVLVVLLADPAAVTGAAFQLSFACVLALVAGYEAARPVLLALRTRRGGRILHHAATLLLTSLLAGAAALPLTAYHFGHVQLYFLAANLVAVPIFALLVMPAGLVALALMPLHLEVAALVPMGWGIGLVSALARLVAGWPGATVDVPAMPAAALACYGAGLCLLCLLRGAGRWCSVPPLAACLALTVLARPPDVLASADMKLVGVRTSQGLVLRAARGGDWLAATQWQQWVGGAASFCPAAECALATRGGVPVLLAGSGGTCGGYALMVVQSGAPPFCPGAAGLGREDAWEEGAWAVWLDRGRVRMLSDRMERGARPWVLLSAGQERRRLTLPLAPAETLPQGFR